MKRLRAGLALARAHREKRAADKQAAARAKAGETEEEEEEEEESEYETDSEAEEEDRRERAAAAAAREKEEEEKRAAAANPAAAAAGWLGAAWQGSVDALAKARPARNATPFGSERARHCDCGRGAPGARLHCAAHTLQHTARLVAWRARSSAAALLRARHNVRADSLR
jgi:hypothetical protein